MGTELKQGLKLGWVRVLLAPQPSSGSSCCSQAKVWSPLPCVWAPWCEAVSVFYTKGLAVSLRKLHLMWIKAV